MIALYDRLIAKTAFPEFNNLQFERNKLNVLRIVLGLIAFARNFQIVDTLYLLHEPKEDVLLGLIHLGVIAMFTVGFLTPLFTWLLLVISISMDVMYGTFTLGTSILCITLLPMALVNTGTSYSVDAILFKHSKFFKRLLTPLYSSSGATSLIELRRAYFLGFLCYAIMSLGAILLHAQDAYWTGGLTTKSLLLNSYLCKYYDWFRAIEAFSPWFLSALSIASSILQSVFQILMIPLIFFTWGRKFIFYWGLNFFLISLFFINLSYLPHNEIVLWFLIFIPIKTSISVKSKNIFFGKLYQKVFLKPEGDLRQFGDAGLISRIAYTIYFAGILLYIGFKFPYIKDLIPKSKSVDHTTRVFIQRIGFDLPNVFNRTDLSMGDHWMEMYVLENDKEILCPITGTEGQRLNYAGVDWMLFNNHNSDKLYYNSTLVFRRGILKASLEEMLKEENNGWRVVKRRVRYDYIKTNRKGMISYRVKIIQTPMSTVSHSQYEIEKVLDAKMIHEFFVDYDGENISIRSAK